MLKALVLAPALALSLLLLPSLISPARCASCVQIAQGPPCQEYWRADAVFVGYVTQAVGVPWPPNVAGWSQYSKLTARLTVEEVFRGDVKAEVVFEMDSCGYPFKEGGRYLVYAHRDREGRLRQQIGHSRTAPLSEAGEDMTYIRGLAGQASAGGRVFGTITQHVSDYRLRGGGTAPDASQGYGPAAGVKVVVEGGAKSYEARTDGEGRFEFSLPAGEYKVHAEGPEGRTGREAARATIHDGGCAPLNIYITLKGEISGRVMSAAGRPVRDARVALFSAESVTEEALAKLWDRPPGMSITNLQGDYRFVQLPAGRYYVAVAVPVGEGPKGINYRSILFPNAASLSGAAVITLAEGQKKTDADIQLSPQ